MQRERILEFKDQLFRRIGYEVGLERLLEFAKMCARVKTHGSLGVRELRSYVERDFEVEGKFARDKIDVAKGLGLLVILAERVTVTAMGRAVVALSERHGSESEEVRAFFLRRIVEKDADYSLTLLMALTASGGGEVWRRFADLLNSLLAMKRDACQRAPLPPSLKRVAVDILSVRERRKTRTPLESIARRHRRLMPSRLPPIEIPDDRLPGSLRHIIDPRKGWLQDVGLVEREAGRHQLSEHGRNLVDFLEKRHCRRDGFVMIEPDADVLRDVAAGVSLVGTAPVNREFFEDMVAYTWHGEEPHSIRPNDEEFLRLISEVYPLVRNERFDQAETAAIREAVQVPLLVRGKRVAFEEAMERCTRRYPERIYTMSSTKARRAYVVLRRREG